MEILINAIRQAVCKFNVRSLQADLDSIERALEEADSTYSEMLRHREKIRSELTRARTRLIALANPSRRNLGETA